MRHALVSCVLITALVTGGCASMAVGFQRSSANLAAERADGIAYLERKPAAGNSDVVVMLHGFGANKDNWDAFSAAMPEGPWLIAPDLPGFGDSVHDAKQSYDVASEVQLLAQFLAARGIKRFHLLGNSLGGWVAASYALAHPEQVASLVLFDPAGIEPPGGFHVPPPMRTVADFDRMMTDLFATPQNIPESFKVAFVEKAIADQPFNDKIAGDLRAHPGDMAAHLEELRPPVLVVWGDKDHVLDVSTAPLWRAKVPGHNVVIMRETGHCPMIERPAESVALVRTWWAREKIVASSSQ